MSKEYGIIVGRVGIILLLTGIVIILVGYFRSSANTNRIDSSLVTYIGVGLALVCRYFEYSILKILPLLKVSLRAL